MHVKPRTKKRSRLTSKPDPRRRKRKLSAREIHLATEAIYQNTIATHLRITTGHADRLITINNPLTSPRLATRAESDIDVRRLSQVFAAEECLKQRPSQHDLLTRSTYAGA